MIIALDIETDGLDPATSRAITAALAYNSQPGPSGMNFDHPDDEPWLLTNLDMLLTDLAAEGPHVLFTWNGSAFDLPFLAERYATNGLPTTLKVAATDEPGKYGRIRYTATWAGIPTVDLAYAGYQNTAEQLGVKWSLKPVAEQLLGVAPMAVDVTGANGALDLDPALRKQYCALDAEMVFDLATRMVGQ